MTSSLRILSLIGCAAGGAILAYAFGSHQALTRLKSEAAPQTSVSQDNSVSPETMVQTNVDAGTHQPHKSPVSAGSPSENAIPETRYSEPLPPQQPRLRIAGEEGREFSQYEREYPEYARASQTLDRSSSGDRVGGFVVPEQPLLLPATRPDLSRIPQVPPGIVPRDLDPNPWNRQPSATSIARFEMPAEHPDTTDSGEVPPMSVPAQHEAADSDLGNLDVPPPESPPIVVLSHDDARPLLTLRLGRSESQWMTPLEMAQRPTTPVTPARPVIRNELPRASLFVEVDDHDLTCTINADHVKLRTLLTMLGERAGIWIAATQHVDGLVSADLTGVRLEEALEQIVSPLGYSVGVRDHAILIGLRDEVAGYDRRLSDRTQYDQAPIGRQGESRQPAAGQQPDERQGPVALPGDTRPLTEQVSLASHSGTDGQPSSVTAAIPTIVPGEVGVENAVHVEPVQEIPLHSNPNGARRPSTEIEINARRVAIANEEDNIVSIIAERAMNLMRAGEYRRTVNMLSQLVTEHNRSAQLFQLLGEAYYHCDQIQAAEVSLKHSLQFYKNDARTNYFMGCTLQKLGDRQRGLHYLLQAHDLDPMYPPIVSERALAPR